MEWYQRRYLDAKDYGADGAQTWYIGGEAISFAVISLQVDAVTDLPTLLQLMEVLDSIKIHFDGDDILNCTAGQDFLPLVTWANYKYPYVHEFSNTDPSNTHISLIVPFGRYPFDTEYGLRKVEREDCYIEPVIDDADTDVDNPRWTLDVFYTPGAVYKGYAKQLSKTITASSTGWADISVDREGKLLGILFFGTTVPSASSDTATLADFQWKENSKIEVWQNVSWVTLYGLQSMFLGGNTGFIEHTHLDQQTAPADTLAAENLNDPFDEYVYMPFAFPDNWDMARDISKLKTAEVNINFGDTNAARMLPRVLVSY